MRIISVVAGLLALAACKPLSYPIAADPSDPAAPVPAARYRAVTGDYMRGRPVEPASWREQNERVAPQPKR